MILLSSLLLPSCIKTEIIGYEFQIDTIAVKNSAATWDVTGVVGIPEGWSVETASA